MRHSNRTWAISFTLSFLSFFANGAQAASVFDFAVISTENVRSHACDFQGSLAAGGNVDVSAFALGTELTPEENKGTRLLVGGSFRFVGGTNNLEKSDVQGDVQLNSVIQNFDMRVGGNVDFLKVTMTGTLKAVQSQPKMIFSSVPFVTPAAPFSLSEELKSLTDEMRNLSKFYQNIQGPGVNWEGNGYRYAVIRGIPRTARTVYTFTESMWRAVNGLRIIGPKASVVVVNVLGKNPSMLRKSVVLSGGIELNTILLNFPEAEDMVVSQSGTPYGTPSILAPYAVVHHSNNLVTGSILVRDYDGDFEHCGQVNHHAIDRFLDLLDVSK